MIFSFFERVQNKTIVPWTEEEINQKLEKRIIKAYHEFILTARTQGIDMRRAAYIVAVSRVVDAMRLRGRLKK